MARMGLTKGERTTLKNCWGTATLFFPIVFDSLSMIGPQITMTALSAIAQSRIFSSKFSSLFYLIADVVGTYC